MYDKGSVVRSHIINTANNLFYHRGFNQTSFSDIADSAGIPKGNFYHYFKSKEALLQSVIDERLKNINQQLQNINKQFSLPTQRIQFFIASLKNNKNGFTQYGCPTGSIISELGKVQTELQLKSKEILDAVLSWLIAQFKQAGFEDTQAEETAIHVLARIQGAIIITHAYQEKNYFTTEIDKLLSQITDQFEAG